MHRLELLKNQLCFNNRTSESKYKFLKISTSTINSQIRIIEINDPSTLNSLSHTLTNELLDCLSSLNNDKDTKIMILTGSGKSFISGADITSFKNESYKDYLKNDKNIFDKLSLFYHLINKPLIAAVNGYCLGGGLEIALCCDLIYCSEKATLSFPEIKLGLFPGGAGSQKLPKLLGIIKANEYILTGKNIDLKDAKNSGLINDIIKHEELISHVENIANDMCKYDITALISAKKAMKYSLESGLTMGTLYEKTLFLPLFDNDGTKNDIDKFLNKSKKK